MENTFTQSHSVDSKTEISSDESEAAFLKEMGYDLEAREKAIAVLETMFGDRVFHHEDYHGTVSVMAISCPAFGEILEQGPPSAAAWLEANDQSQEDIMDDSKKEQGSFEDQPVEHRETAKKQNTNTEHESIKTDKPTRAKADKKTAVDTKSETSQISESPAITQNDKIVIAKAQDNHNDKSEQISKVSKAKQVDVLASETKATDSKVSTAETIVPDTVQSISEEKEPKDNKEEKAFPKSQIEKYLEESVEGDRTIVAEVLIHKVDQETSASYEFQPESSKEIVTLNNEVTAGSAEMIDANKNPITDSESIKNNFVDRNDENGEEVAVFADKNGDREFPESDSDILIAQNVMENGGENTSELEVQELPSDDDTAAAETIVEVMMNELVQSENIQSSEYQEIIQNRIELETLSTEIIEILSELIPEAPELKLDVSEEYIVVLIRQTSSIREVIEVLEKSKTAEECREALKFIRIELASLLRLLGYENPDKLAENLVKQYGMLTLKKYLVLIKTPLTTRKKVDSSKIKPSATLMLPQHFGTHAVRALVQLTFNTSASQAV